MKLCLYDPLLRLYPVADFLGLDKLQDLIIAQLHLSNIRLAKRLQPVLLEEQRKADSESQGGKLEFSDIDNWAPFTESLVKSAEIAYKIPSQADREEDEPYPKGIRLPIVELFTFTRFALLADNALVRRLDAIPGLLSDVLHSLNVIDEVGTTLLWRSYCGGVNFETTEECGDCGKSPEIYSAKLKRMVPNEEWSFWIAENYCFDCVCVMNDPKAGLFLAS